MAAYPECYLNEIVETQGKLFEYVADITPKVNVEDFINKYMMSKTRMYLDRTDAYLSNLNAKELYDYFCQTENFTPKKGKGLDGFKPNWIGQFYAFYQWKNNTPSVSIIKKLPLEFMEASYYGLHDLDIDLAEKKIKV